MLITGGTQRAPAQNTFVSLTLAECVSRSLQQHPSLMASEARLLAAEGKYREVRSAVLPQLRLSSRAALLSSVEEFAITLPVVGRQTLFPVITRNYSARLSLQQPLFAGFRLAKSLDIAEDQVGAATEDLVRDRAELELNVTVAYWHLYRARKLEEALAQSVAQLTERLREVRNFADQGLATEGDVLKVQAQRSDVKLQHVEAQSGIRLAAMALNSMIGMPLDMETIPADTPSVAASGHGEQTLAKLIGLAKRGRPELRAMTHRQSMSEAGVSAARGGWFPQVMLTAGYDYSRPNPRVIPPKDTWEGTWDVGLSLQWNLWDWSATSAQTTQAEAALAQTQASRIQLEDVVALDVAQNYFKQREALEKIAVAEDGLKQATESHRMTSEKFKQGLVTNADMLDAETALLQARISFTNALIDHALAMARLSRAIGTGMQ
jgi:outer membrane protein TolC